MQTVNIVASNGPGSLRSAINAANNTDELDEIHFDIDGEGVHVVTPAIQLPLIEHPLSIRGYTQDGADPAVDELPGTPTIVINASQVSRGLDIASDDVEVRPNGFAGVEVVGSDNVVGGPDPKDRRGLLGAAAIAAFVAIAGSPL